MNQMTAFERALLKQFETLAAGSEASLTQSETTARALSELSERFGERVRQIEQQQSALSKQLEAVTEALNTQTEHTNGLVDAVNRLLTAQSK